MHCGGKRSGEGGAFKRCSSPVLLVGVAAFCLGSQLLSVAVAMRMAIKAKRPVARVENAPAISVVQPLSGVDRFSEETLRAILALDYPDYEVVFCVANARDPIVPMARRAMAAAPERQASLLIGEAAINANPKLNNFAKGWRAAKNDWIVVVDANLLPPRDYLWRLLAAWRPGTGVVSAPPIGTHAETFAAEVECAFLNTNQARWQMTADALGLGFAQGKTLFYRRDILEAGGGVTELGTELAEDAATTKIVRRLGLKARLALGPFEQPLGARSWRAVWGRQVRWARLRRASFPLFYALEILNALPLPAVCVALAAAMMDAHPALVTLAYVGVWWAVEVALADAAGWGFRLRTLAALPVRDALMPWLWLQAWFGHEFEWRGHAMSVDRKLDDEKHAAV